MDVEGIDTRRIFDAGELEKCGFIFTGYESEQLYRARKTESEKKIVIGLELSRRKAPYVKKWNDGPSDTLRRREMIGKGLSYGAFAGDRMVGVLVMERRTWNDTLHIEDLEVMPDWRGRGVGRLLMAKADGVARELGVRAISLETQNTNVPAVRFYRRNGYEIECVDMSLYTNSDAEDGEVAIIMKKKMR
jgi:ribosomal protein S18 acetylase RimI-like enzyme